MDQELVARATELLDLCRTKRLKIAAVESCTGGLVAATSAGLFKAAGMPCFAITARTESFDSAVAMAR